ncbi:Rieske 2Fe-2S domain-containing protein [Streptomyces sp. NPDC055078]
MSDRTVRTWTPDDLFALGLRDRWYGLCPSSQIAPGELVRIDRAGEQLLLWRDSKGEIHVQEDRCPHRAARLSIGVHMGDRVACNYHGVQVDAQGVVVSVPGSPGCALEGQRAVRTFEAVEYGGAVFAWFGLDESAPPKPFSAPLPIAGGEWEAFLCYVEWDCSYLVSLDNLLDPMHGAFLHRNTHAMSQGKKEAAFQIRDTETGFFFEKTDQRNVNFDWVEWVDTGYPHALLDIPYPPTAGPGGPFAIVASLTPMSSTQHAGFFWRCRRVEGWERDSWRFLYKHRLEARHWHVLGQDREMAETMPLDATDRENLYQHDIALVRMRRMIKSEARRQAKQLGSAKAVQPAVAGATSA